MHSFFRLLSRLAGRELRFPYADSDLSALENAISFSRLSRYQAAFGGDRRKALECHYWNTRLSQLLYFPIQMYEIALRNAIDQELCKAFGEKWLVDQQEWLKDRGLSQNKQRQDIENAKRQLKHNKKFITHSSVLAQLDLGFWTELLNSHYASVLWAKYLYRSFPNYKGESHPLYKHLKKIRELRNKISHCQQVLFSCNHYFCTAQGMKDKYESVLTALRWISVPTCEWVKENALFEHAVDEFVTLYHDIQVRTEKAVLKSLDRNAESGFVTLVGDKQDAILHKDVLDNDDLWTQLEVGCLVTCEVALTLQGWRVTRLLWCSAPPIIKNVGTIAAYIEQKNYAFIEVFGESRRVFCPSSVLRQAGLVYPRRGTNIETQYVESAQGLVAKKIKVILQ
jgi:cold shock CspA family protein